MERSYLRRCKCSASFICFICLFCLLFLGSCERKLEHAYDIDKGLERMSSVSISQTKSLKARTFAASLCIPEESELNSDDISAPVCLLFCDSSKDGPVTLSYKNPYARTYPASITKIMSVLVCLKNVEDLSREFMITENSVIHESGSSTAFLQVGETMRIEDLLYALMLPSGNDAAVAVAEATAGDLDSFVKLMNDMALSLGCTGTHFSNPHGLPDETHYTTAYDIYLILREAMKYETFRQVAGAKTHEVHYKDRNGMPKKQTWNATNLYLTGERELPNDILIQAGKTGTTSKAGYCLALDVVKMSTGKECISIVMKAESKNALYTDMSVLLNKIH